MSIQEQIPYTSRNTPWSPEKVDRLKELLPQGLSAADIARDIGVSRSAVLGKIFRMGISSVAKKKAWTRSSAEEIAKRKQLAEQRRSEFACNEITELTPEQSATAVGFWKLADTHCKWPVSGDARDLDSMKFCGAQPIKGTAYCLHHQFMAHKPGSDE